MQDLTLDKVASAQKKIAEKKQRVLSKYQKLYPNIDPATFPLHSLCELESENNICANCKGLPCKKKGNQGFKRDVVVQNEMLYVNVISCKYAKIGRNTRAAKIPPMYANKTFDDYKVDADNAGAVQGAKTLCSLYIYGSPGTGKTFLASIMANELLKQGKTVRFADTPSLLDEIRSTFTNKYDKTDEKQLETLMRYFGSADVLILDDLGTETPTQWAIERLFLIINERYNAGKMLIVTSNYDLQEAAERLNHPSNGGNNLTGSRIVSRIKGICKVAKLHGSDRRHA